MQYLYDHKGNRYLDLEANGGNVSVGHSHPAITKIITDQSAKLIHTSTIYMGETHT
jgi:acetylornithine/N-succinyldiaminopimelate aminotransferase